MQIKPKGFSLGIADRLIKIRQGISRHAAGISPVCQIIKSMQIGFLGLVLSIASACTTNQTGTTNQATGKHMVWVPAETGSHLGGHWVEVDQTGTPPAGASNVQKANAEELQRQAQSMGSSGSGN
jgi:hypothetical protein